jgi:DNA replication protein DnaC
MPTQQLIEEKLTINLRKLELLQLERRLDAIIQEKSFSGKSFKEQLNLLLEDELTFRQERAIKMRLKLAKFPVVKSIDGFDFSFQPDLDRETVLSLFGLSFVREKENIILIGPSGVGKTHLAIALGVAACQGGYTCYFTTFQNLMENLRKAEEQNRLRRKLLTYNKPHVLIIDELGYLPLSRIDANLFFQLVSTRYENGPTILTSNKSYIDWNDFFPDEGIAAAILDRLLHYSRTIKINGQSYRLAMKKKMGLFEKSKQ